MDLESTDMQDASRNFCGFGLGLPSVLYFKEFFLNFINCPLKFLVCLLETLKILEVLLEKITKRFIR